MRRVLIVSPHFPPTNAPDHQRVRTSLPYFRENGWEAVVLAVEAAAVSAPRDAQLSATLPPDVTVHRVGAWSAEWTRFAGFGNVAYRAWSALRQTGDQLLATGRFDLVYFSTTQFVATALGRRWRRRFGVPFIVDLQDPWVTDYYERPGAPRPPGGWKHRLARWQAARLEGPAWEEAAGFISVSPDYLSNLAARHPWFAAKPSAVIPFGVAETDLETARVGQGIDPAFTREPGCVHLVNVGAVGPIMRPALELLFSAVRALRAADPAQAARLRFHFIGTSYAADQPAPSVLPVAQDHDVADLVEERPGRVGYFVALKTLLAADALVIPGSDDPAYTPSKLATCFLADRPTLALPLAGSAFARNMAAMNFDTIAAWPAERARDIVHDFLRQRLAGEPAPAKPADVVAAFAREQTARARTREQCEFFHRALAQRP